MFFIKGAPAMGESLPVSAGRHPPMQDTRSTDVHHAVISEKPMPLIG